MPTLNAPLKTSLLKTRQSVWLSLAMLGTSAMATTTLHAEQFCKSVDASGATSYVLAPSTGCNKKKYTPVSVSHHITPQPTPVAAAATTPAASAPAATATTAAPAATVPAPTTQAASPPPTPNVAPTSSPIAK